MSWLKKIGILADDAGNPAPQPTPQVTAGQAVAPLAPPVPGNGAGAYVMSTTTSPGLMSVAEANAYVPAPSVASQDAPNPALCAEIEKRVFANPGVAEYQRFMILFASLAAVIPEEPKRYSAAFAVAQGQGLSKDRILTALRQAHAVLNAERAGYERSVDAQLAQSTKGKETEVNSIASKIDAAQKQLATLQAEITRLGHEIGSLTQSRDAARAAITAERGKAEGQKGEFARAHGAVEQKFALAEQQVALYG